MWAALAMRVGAILVSIVAWFLTVLYLGACCNCCAKRKCGQGMLLNALLLYWASFALQLVAVSLTCVLHSLPPLCVCSRP